MGIVDQVLMPRFGSSFHISSILNDHSIWVDLLKSVGLLNSNYSISGGNTVFAPNNDAFERLFDDLQITMEQLKESEILKDLLFYHATKGVFLAEDLEEGDLTMITGGDTEVMIGDTFHVDGFAIDGLKLKDGQGRESDVIIANLQTQGGVVHIVDNVMVPEFGMIGDIVFTMPQFSILLDLVIAADLQGLLTVGPFTLFAPTNDAFNDLLDDMDVTLDDLKSLPILKDILLYHVIGDYKLLTTDFQEREYETRLNGQTIRWNEEGNGCSNRRGLRSRSGSDIDDNGESGGCTDGFKVEGYQVIDAFGDVNDVVIGNLRASNGVVHAIDKVLLPTEWDGSSQLMGWNCCDSFSCCAMRPDCPPCHL